MGLGRRCKERQASLWLAADQLGSGPRNAFYDKLNELLAEIGFDEQLEAACEPYYARSGRKGLAPGVYFRMLFIGFFEDISSQRGIAWRCEDSRSLARFLGFSPGEGTPDHSTLSLTRERLPILVHRLAFELILDVANNKGLLQGKTIGVDASDLEANASMKSIVRRDTGDNWREYLCKLYAEETGDNDPTDEDLRRFDKTRKKRVSNQQWKSSTDDDARIGRMKDGRTHLKYKVENAVDLETELILAAEVYAGDQGDTLTVGDTVVAAQTNVAQVDADCEIQEVVADKGYHSAASLDHLQHAAHVRTYIPEQRRTQRRKWQGKSAEVQQAYCRNKRNTRGARGRRLQRLRSERVQRVFAHLLDTGGGRRTWLRGLDKVRKRYLMVAMAFNLGRVMRSLFGAGKPRHLAVLAEKLRLLQILVWHLMAAWRSAHQVVTAMRRNKLTASVAVAA